MCNMDWRLKFGEACVKILPRVFFDHYIITINLRGGILNKEDKPFHFEVV